VVSPIPQVLIVDDDEAVRDALTRTLAAVPLRVIAAPDGQTALDLTRREQPDAAVVDVVLPGIDGIALIRRLRALGYDFPICVLSAREQVADRVAGLEAGADDYLVKPFAIAELTARLQALLRRAPRPLAVARTIGDLRIDPPRRLAQLGGTTLHLTRREYDLLETFLRHRGVVLSRAQLLDQVWGYGADVDSNVVDIFVGYLRRKLEVGQRPRLLHTVRGIGFVLRIEED
jgi:two-component system, OmpR family, response regulator PrrA